MCTALSGREMNTPKSILGNIGQKFPNLMKTSMHFNVIQINIDQENIKSKHFFSEK